VSKYEKMEPYTQTKRVLWFFVVIDENLEIEYRKCSWELGSGRKLGSGVRFREGGPMEVGVGVGLVQMEL
jgi:hypothetical protein